MGPSSVARRSPNFVANFVDAFVGPDAKDHSIRQRLATKFTTKLFEECEISGLELEIDCHYVVVEAGRLRSSSSWPHLNIWLPDQTRIVRPSFIQFEVPIFFVPETPRMTVEKHELSALRM